MQSTETILCAVRQLQPANRNIVGTVASALLASQKLQPSNPHAPACPLTSSGAEIIHEAMKKGVQCK